MLEPRFFLPPALLMLAGLGAAWADDKVLVRGDPPLTQGMVRDQAAIHRLLLQQWDDARRQQIRALSDLQASHHSTMMLIIDNMRPSGRYEYNPATGRYDCYVPYPPRR
jgi:hypothetical protein